MCIRDSAYPRRKLGRAIRTDRYRLVEWKNHAEPNSQAEYELYDYKTDPWETKNHAAGKSNIVGKLKAILARHPEPKTRARR